MAYPLDPARIPELAFRLCTHAERHFLQGVAELQRFRTLKAMVAFDKAYRADRRFFDAVYMGAALRLCLDKVDEGRQKFLSLLAKKPDFCGGYIMRFLPNFRLLFFVCYGYYHNVRPIASDVATMLGVLYLREGKMLEAKKILQQAVNADPANNFACVMLAWALFVDRRYQQVVKLIDKPVYNYKSPLDSIAMSICGKANLALGDTRTGLLQMETAYHFTYSKAPELLDGFRIEIAREYEAREYLIDALEALQGVSDPWRIYNGCENVDTARQRIECRIATMRAEGIKNPLRFLKQGSPDSRREDFWEIKAVGAK
jgi:tetratricopeptide (TPR) repeat protein